MNKKIKVIISLIIILIGIMASTTVLGATFSPIQKYPYRQNGNIYFCKQKGGALRFWEGEAGVLHSESNVYLGYTTDLTDAANISDSTVVSAGVEGWLSVYFDPQNSGYWSSEMEGWNGNLEMNNLSNDGKFDKEVKGFNSGFLTSYVRAIDYTGRKIAKKPVYNLPGTIITNTNNRIAYILSSGKNIPTNTASTNYIPTISDSVASSSTYLDDIQHALWNDTDYYNEGYNPNNDTVGLHNEAIQYENFYNANIKNGYNAYFNEQRNPKVIVNRTNQTYTVGPFVLTYPDDGRFSYIENMHITNQDGSVSTTNFTIIKESSDRKYPNSGEKFFIEFSASSLNYPTQVKIFADFNYLNNTYAQYQRITGTGKLYQYYGWVDLKIVQEFWKYEKGDYVSATISSKTGTAPSTNPEPGKSGDYWVEIEYSQINSTTYREKITKYTLKRIYKFHRYINWEAGIKDLSTTYSAQTAAIVDESSAASRTWQKAYTNTDAAGITIKLETQVAGRVWVDQSTGKETEVNGIYGSEDKVMQGMEVVLFRYGDNAVMGTKYTDSNGQYVFGNLSALSQYYVRFKYNGQYYEPTHYTTPTNTVEDWKNTSNGTDFITDRNSFNAKFASIGSSPANYLGSAGYNKTYSKKDLLGYTINSSGEYVKTNKAVIDEFGNLIENSSSDTELQKKIQYVEDCQMYSYTRNLNNTIDPYPASNIVVINNTYDRYGNIIKIEIQTSSGDAYSYAGAWGIINVASEDKTQYINQGYKARQEADISLKEDIDSATIEINGKTQVYKYNGRETSTEDESKWEIAVRLSDGYYNTQYSRELFPSDYQYKVSSYGDPAKYGKTKDDELKVYVTYRLYVKNQSMSIRTKIDEIVHYYDSDYEYVPDRSYIEIERGNNKGTYDVRKSDTSRYSSIPGTTTNLNGYQTMYITGLDGIYLDAGQSANIYLTFVVEKDVKDGEDWIKLDENEQTASPIGVGKESISEINGYSTVYKVGTNIPNVGNTTGNTVAGLVDVDSNPGNLNPADVPKDGTINYKNFEDDTDKAPNIKLILYREDSSARIVTGYVWEDERTQIIESQATATGNGIREDGEKLINGVTVELVEVMDNGTEYIWRTYENGSGTSAKTSPIINIAGIVKDYEYTGDTTGTYAFKSFVPGNYIVRFKYGDTVKTVLANNTEATNLLLNEYELTNALKALLNDTSYNGQDYKSTSYQIGLNGYNGKNTSKQYNYDIAKGDTALVSDAKDLYDRRLQVIDYSDDQIKNAFAELLDSYQNVPSYNDASYNKEMMKSLLNEFIAKTSMIAETGIIGMEVEYNTAQTTGNSINNTTTYHLANLDLGLEERPKAQIEINKDVKNVKITLANGNVLFDATQSTDNLLWQPNTFAGYYQNNLMYIRTPREFGLVQPTMDQELMHGATVRITYEITAKNIGETDYKEEQFYYTGVVNNKNNIVTTNAIKIVDYIPNNIQYYEIDNKDYWKVITTDELISQGLVNGNLRTNLDKFNTKVITEKTNTPLVPTIYTEKVDSSKLNSVSVPLVLTQLITAENDTKDLTYNNKVELVLQSNTVGRKMAYSVPGNQDPTGEILELDADVSKVSILPPFGAILTYTIIALITIAGAAIIAVGIIFIKKKVLIK